LDNHKCHNTTVYLSLVVVASAVAVVLLGLLVVPMALYERSQMAETAP
jgi:hypothetical protein